MAGRTFLLSAIVHYMYVLVKHGLLFDLLWDKKIRFGSREGLMLFFYEMIRLVFSISFHVFLTF